MQKHCMPKNLGAEVSRHKWSPNVLDINFCHADNTDNGKEWWGWHSEIIVEASCCVRFLLRAEKTEQDTGSLLLTAIHLVTLQSYNGTQKK